MWHAEHKKVVDYVQDQDWDATLEQQAVEMFQLPLDLKAARWGPVLSFSQALSAAAAWLGPPATGVLSFQASCMRFRFTVCALGRTLSGTSLTGGDSCRTPLLCATPLHQHCQGTQGFVAFQLRRSGTSCFWHKLACTSSSCQHLGELDMPCFASFRTIVTISRKGGESKTTQSG